MNFEIKYDHQTDILKVQFDESLPAVTFQEYMPGTVVGFDANNALRSITVNNPFNHIQAMFGLYRTFFVNHKMYRFNQFLYSLGISGIGILNYETPEISGELFFVDLVKKLFDQPVIFDIGANVGNYSKLLRSRISASQILAFEPNPVSFEKLKEISLQNHFTAINEGFGDQDGYFTLFDYADKPGSEHASVYQDVIEILHKGYSKSFNVKLNTLDQFCETNQINGIHLLKVDTEGNELRVFLGAKKMIAEQRIELIQFEFNEMNVISRSFMQDFRKALPGYKLFRLLPDGLVFVANDPLWEEIFKFQNIVAIPSSTLTKIEKVFHGVQIINADKV